MAEIRFSSNVDFSSSIQHIPHISQDIKACVVIAIEEAAEEFDVDEINYIRKKIDKKIACTRKSTTYWIREVTNGYEALYSWFEKKLSQHSIGNDPLLRFVGACIFYFINPFDIIPDHTMGIGFADDALALNYTLRKLPKEWLAEID